MNNQCVVLDFDCTLTKRHFYYFLYGINAFINMYKLNDKAIKYINLSNKINQCIKYDTFDLSNEDKNDFVDIIFNKDRFNTLVIFLENLNKNKINTIISSNGTFGSILWVLKLLGLQKYFRLINASKKIYIHKNDIPELPNGYYIEQSICKPFVQITKDLFFKSCIFPHYNTVIYVDDDSKEHNVMVLYNIVGPKVQSSNTSQYKQFYEEFVDNNKKYYFISLPKENETGFNSNEINAIHEILNVKLDNINGGKKQYIKYAK